MATAIGCCRPDSTDTWRSRSACATSRPRCAAISTRLSSGTDPGCRLLGPTASGAGEAGGDGELVDEVVHLVTGVPFHPLEGDVFALSDRVDEWLPQVTVGDRLLLRVGPAALQPPGPPLVAEAVDDIRRVAHHDQQSREGRDGFECGTDLHALVRARSLGSRREPFPVDRPRPATGSGVP